MKKPSRKTLRNKLDKIGSEIVRARGYCVWCGNKNQALLQCAHIYSRNNLQTRWDFLNLLCLCAGCHFKAHQKPLEFADFVIKFLGEEKYTLLVARANEHRTFANYELEDLYKRFLEIKSLDNANNL